MPRNAHFRVDPRLARLLGENYRSTEQALKELVDNAFDADADDVHITLPDPLTDSPIVIIDNGSGMTENEVREEYLKIASDRRSRKGDRTKGYNRLVKGRKGIGKFAGLMTADVMVVETTARGKTARLTIKREDLLSSQTDLERIDLPLEANENTGGQSGTTITLSKLNQNLAFPDPDKLRRLLVLEYGRQDNFNIFVNGEQLNVEDIPGETFIKEEEIEGIGKIIFRYTISDGNKPLKHSGIALRVEGKIVGKATYLDLEQDEHISPKMLKKVYGEIEADGLADVVTADWGAIIENSKAFEVIRSWATPVLREGIEKTFAKEINLSKARLQLQIERELAKLPEHRREAARLTLDRVLKKLYGESQDRIETIISVVIEAFERDEYWVVIQNIEQADHQDVEAFADALTKFGLMDMASMAQQASRRLKILDDLDELIRKPSTLEKTIHKVIEKNLWIFGAEYALISSNRTLAIVIEDYTNKKFKGDRANKRPDLFLCSSWSGNHLLIEFKRPSHSITRDDATQAEKYRDDLLDKFSKIDVVVIGGRKHELFSYRNERDDLKVFSYVGLISEARQQLQWLFDQLMADRQAA
jgi:hypothetical protein